MRRYSEETLAFHEFLATVVVFKLSQHLKEAKDGAQILYEESREVENYPLDRQAVKDLYMTILKSFSHIVSAVAALEDTEEMRDLKATTLAEMDQYIAEALEG